MPPGDVEVVTVDMTIPIGTPHLTMIPNVATATDDEGDEDDGEADIIVIAPPDLAIDKDGPSSVHPGQQFPFSITVRNIGIGPAVGPIIVTDTLPPGLTFVSGGGNGWTCGAVAQIVTCTNPASLAPGQSTFFQIVVRAGNVEGSFLNTATVGPPDPNPDNNTDTFPIVIFRAAPAPALSPLGMGIALLLLSVVAAVAMRRAAKR
jgi:uncharacterized repeat protein (TIGR01451 family)